MLLLIELKYSRHAHFRGHRNAELCHSRIVLFFHRPQVLFKRTFLNYILRRMIQHRTHTHVPRRQLLSIGEHREKRYICGKISILHSVYSGLHFHRHDRAHSPVCEVYVAPH